MKKYLLVFGIAFALTITAVSYISQQNGKQISALISTTNTSTKEELAPHVPKQAVITIKDDKNLLAPQSIQRPSSAEVKTIVNDYLQKNINDPTLTVKTEVFFDEKETALSENRNYRIRKQNAQNQTMTTNSVEEPKRLIFAHLTSQNIETEKLIEMAKELPIVEYTQPNYMYSTPSDNTMVINANSINAEDPNILWNIFNNLNGAGVDANKIWEKGYTGKGVTIAVIDTGVDIDHPDLQQNIWKNTGETDCFNNKDDDGNGYIDDCHGWDFGDNDNDPNGIIFHGTHVSGIIAAAKNSFGVVGVAHEAKIMPLKVFPDNGYAQTIDVVNAMEYAFRNNADIITTSLGREDDCSSIELQSIQRAFNSGVFVSASSGNENPDGGFHVPFPNSPAVCNQMFAAGATNKQKQLASYSNYFQEMVDMVGPGGESGDSILSTTIDGGYTGSSGTSMATPHAAGIVAMLLQKNPKLTPTEITDIFCKGAHDLGPVGRDTHYGCGFMNAQSIFAASEGPSPQISNAEWSPNTLSKNEKIGKINFSVCDPDGNLSGGEVRVMWSGTDIPVLGKTILWDEHSPVPNATDCAQPQRYEFPVNFEDLDPGHYCADISVTDTNANESNKISNICITKEKPIDGIILNPIVQVLEIGETPAPITAKGDSDFIYKLYNGGTGVEKVNCENGENSTCQLSAPTKDGIITLVVTDGKYKSTAQIFVGGEADENNFNSTSSTPPSNPTKDLFVEMKANKTAAAPGEEINYTITYSNQGEKSYEDIIIVSTFDKDRLTIIRSPVGCTISTPKITCKIGALSAGSSGTITYTAKVKKR
jgi:subtilisin family serine protease